MSTPRVPAGVPTGGQFAASARAEPGLSLSPATADPVTVPDRDGNPVTVTPGVLDNEARYLYSSGQCLALAVAISERTGWPVYLRVGHGLIGRRRKPVDYVIHAMVQTPDGDCIDVRDARRPGDWPESRYEIDPVVTPAAQSRTLLSTYAVGLEVQDVALAESFVDPVLDERGLRP